MSLFIHHYTLIPKSPLNAKMRIEGGRAREVKGVLIRNEKGGVGCLQVWEELGDPSLEAQLSALKRGEPLALGAQALLCANRDAQAREEGVPLLEHPNWIPPSHGTLPPGVSMEELENMYRAGFRTMKLKVSGQSEMDRLDLVAKLEEMSYEFPDLLWRLDFNGTLPPESVYDMWTQANEATRDGIELFEDPSPFDEQNWYRWKRQGIRMGLDRLPSSTQGDWGIFLEDFYPHEQASRRQELEEKQKSLRSEHDGFWKRFWKGWTEDYRRAKFIEKTFKRLSFDFVVYKPALARLPRFFVSEELRTLYKMLGCPIIVTSYMEHPVGQVWAAYSSMLLNRALAKILATPGPVDLLNEEDRNRLPLAGLVTQHLYEETPFSDYMGEATPEFPVTHEGDTGLGFDSLLDELDWKAL